MGLRPLLVQFATWRFVKEKGVGRVSYLLPQGVPRFLFCYPSTPLRAVVSQISTFLTVAYRRSITLVQNRMKVTTAALIVKRLQVQDAARRAASQSATQSVTQSVTQSASQDASKAEQTEKTVTLTVKREGEELTTAAKRAEMAVKQEEEPKVPVKQEEEPKVPVKQEEEPKVPVKQEREEPTMPVKQEEEPKVAVKQEGEKKTVPVKQEGEKPTATAQSPLKIRVKVKTEVPTDKSLLNEVLEAPQWQQPDRSDASPR